MREQENFADKRLTRRLEQQVAAADVRAEFERKCSEEAERRLREFIRIRASSVATSERSTTSIHIPHVTTFHGSSEQGTSSVKSLPAHAAAVIKLSDSYAIIDPVKSSPEAEAEKKKAHLAPTRMPLALFDSASSPSEAGSFEVPSSGDAEYYQNFRGDQNLSINEAPKLSTGGAMTVEHPAETRSQHILQARTWQQHVTEPSVEIPHASVPSFAPAHNPAAGISVLQETIPSHSHGQYRINNVPLSWREAAFQCTTADEPMQPYFTDSTPSSHIRAYHATLSPRLTQHSPQLPEGSPYSTAPAPLSQGGQSLRAESPQELHELLQYQQRLLLTYQQHLRQVEHRTMAWLPHNFHEQDNTQEELALRQEPHRYALKQQDRHQPSQYSPAPLQYSPACLENDSMMLKPIMWVPGSCQVNEYGAELEAKIMYAASEIQQLRKCFLDLETKLRGQQQLDGLRGASRHNPHDSNSNRHVQVLERLLRQSNTSRLELQAAVGKLEQRCKQLELQVVKQGPKQEAVAVAPEVSEQVQEQGNVLAAVQRRCLALEDQLQHLLASRDVLLAEGERLKQQLRDMGRAHMPSSGSAAAASPLLEREQQMERQQLLVHLSETSQLKDVISDLQASRTELEEQLSALHANHRVQEQGTLAELATVRVLHEALSRQHATLCEEHAATVRKRDVLSLLLDSQALASAEERKQWLHDLEQRIASEVALRKDVEDRFASEVALRKDVEDRFASEVALRKDVEDRFASEVALRKDAEDRFASEVALRKDVEDRFASEVALRKDVEDRFASEVALRKDVEDQFASEVALRKDVEDRFASEVALRKDVEDRFASEVALRKDVEDRFASEVALRKDVEDRFASEVALRKDVEDRFASEVVLRKDAEDRFASEV
ncbi:hypothetical protein CEUSTIGMA_g269.t1, partial [Chlamydomonas eustigma]